MKSGKYAVLSRGINTFDSNEWVKTVRDVWGNQAKSFAVCYIAQLAREYKVYPDYDPVSNGYFNPEDACSIMADVRNNAAIRKSYILFADEQFKRTAKRVMDRIHFEPMPYKCLWRSNYDNEITTVVVLCVTKLHRTLQQNLCTACIRILKEEDMLKKCVTDSFLMI